jgi:hypothetical protein
MSRTARTAAQRKRSQRQRDKAVGWVDVTVRVPADHVQAVRDFAASLPPPSPPSDPRQIDLIERIDDEDTKE